MHKENIIACYFKRDQKVNCVERFCELYPEFASHEPLQPEFLKTSLDKETQDLTTKESSVTQTLTLVSGMSRIQVDSIIFKEIVVKRKNHPIFLKLETENPKKKKWYFIDDHTKNYMGPYSAEQMNKFFELHRINPRTKVKRRVGDDDYFFFSHMIKRYYKNVLTKDFNLNDKNVSLPNKFSKFQKGEYIVKPIKYRENYQHTQREERTLSLATRPNLVYLTDMLPADSDEDDDNCYSRLRANTLAN